jgi:hypothetical protein
MTERGPVPDVQRRIDRQRLARLAVRVLAVQALALGALGLLQAVYGG